MSRDQVWDAQGNLIEQIETPELEIEPTAEDVLADLIQVLVDKGVIY